MHEYYAYEGACLYPFGAGCRLPKEAVPVEHPFSPLVILFARGGRVGRGIFAIQSEAELFEPEVPSVLLQPVSMSQALPCLPEPVRAILQQEGACALNTAFSRCYAVLKRFLNPPKRPRIVLVGLGDVGGTVLIGLKLLGTEIDSIGIFDPNEAQCARYEMELNQVLPPADIPLPPVYRCNESALFDCDALLFTASRGVPPLTEKTGDVRMVQFEANRAMLSHYAKKARDCGFSGLFAQISDPVDPLARAVFLDSNQDERGNFDRNGLLPEQVQGYGLGVMHARAQYYARKAGLDADAIRAYGPHGTGLIVANAPGAEYDDALSKTLTEQAATANLRVRELGFKPYLAPGLSSACVSVLKTLRGEWHDGAVPMGGAYFGCRSRFTPNGPMLWREPILPALAARLDAAHSTLKEFLP